MLLLVLLHLQISLQEQVGHIYSDLISFSGFYKNFVFVDVCSQIGSDGRCDVPQLETSHSPCTSIAACTASSCPHGFSSVGAANCRFVPKVKECKVYKDIYKLLLFKDVFFSH